MDDRPPDLYALDDAGLRALVTTMGQPAFRAGRIRRWLYEGGVDTTDAMTDLPAPLRARLAAETTIGSLTVAAEQRSSDGTVKRLYRLRDGHHVESVLMTYEDGRRTACISTQAGCAMACRFCATGQMGFVRHLDATEIFEQAARFSTALRARGERLSNVVLMGMGEPFHNYDASLTAVRRLLGDLGIGARHVTVSTVGLVPQILRFADEGLQVRLAVSLHAATDEERSALLPVNKRWPIADVLDACRTYVSKTGRRVTFEWALIAGTNDDELTADRLGRLLRGLPSHVNLIPLNPTAGYAGQPTAVAAAERFVDVLASHGVAATVRVRRGIDIDAGCGQLAAKSS